MGISKNEINLRRLLAAAPQQQNQAKLIHVSPDVFQVKLFVLQEFMSFYFFALNLQYVATLREQLEQLAEERTPEGLPR